MSKEKEKTKKYIYNSAFLINYVSFGPPYSDACDLIINQVNTTTTRNMSKKQLQYN